MKKLLSLVFVSILFSSCAQTNLYHDGKLVASFQGDMKGVEFSSSPKGGMTLKATSIDHSTATLAQGDAAAKKLNAAGTALAISGVPALFK